MLFTFVYYNKEINYKVTVKTSEEFSSGTDANVSLNIFGSSASTGNILLDKNKSANKKTDLFEKGSMNEFSFEANDIGKVIKIQQESQIVI